MKTATFADRPAWKLALFAAFSGVFAYLLSRNLGLHANIFADEWYYSKMARLAPLNEAILPSYLYLWLFRGSNSCGDGFYDCVRFGNILLFLGGAPFVYLIAREVTGKALAGLVALMSVLAPLNFYTAYFMPEATYYFGFCILSWVALTRSHWHWAAHALATGLVLGLMSLVKVHALFLLPPLCLFLLYAHWARGGAWLGNGLAAMAVAAAATLAVKFALGYALAGDAALNLFGNFYGAAANSAGKRSVLTLLPPAFVSGRGHLMALAILLPLPLALLAQSVLRPPARGEAGKLELLQLYALLMMGAAAGLTIAFTASIANPGLTDEGLRLHLRYYSFVFPLLWIVAAAMIGKPVPAAKPALRWAIALLLAALLALALVKLPTYALNPVDGPDVFAVSPRLMRGQAVIGLGFAVLLLWALGSRLAAPLFVFVATPAMLICGVVATDYYLSQLRPDRPTDRAGLAVRRHVAPAERHLVTIAGTDLQQLLQTQFNIDDKDTALFQLPSDAPIEHYQLPARNKWLLVLGNHPLPPGIKPVAQTAEYALVRVNADIRRIAKAQLSEPFGKGLIASAEGLSYAESWGRWSDAKRVVIEFNAPLPRHLSVILKAQAFDVNTTLPFTMRVGGKSVPFRLSWLPQDIALHFDTDGSARSIVIDVPHPIAPAERGQPNDSRKIGIGISEIEIGSWGEPVVADN